MAGAIAAAASFISSAIGGGLLATQIATGALVLGARVALVALASRFISSRLKTPQIPKQQDLKRQLRFSSSLPIKRFAYGDDLVPGTEIPWPVVGENAYAAYLINSRPSVGPFTLFVDQREVPYTGDPFDFTGPGATPTADADLLFNHLRFWIGRGDQVGPPDDYITEAGYTGPGDDELLWRSTDGAQGSTVLYCIFRSGGERNLRARWPNAIPKVDLKGRMTAVWDPRDGAQSLSDPSTWVWSDNQALILLDVLTQNPFRPYDVRNLDIDSFIAAANAADEAVALQAGGAEPRYRATGLIPFNGSEIEDIVDPILRAGASELVWIGGQLGVIPGVARDASGTISDSFGGLGFTALQDDASLVNQLRVTYTSAARNGESAELPPYAIPGALAEDGGQPKVATLDLSMVTSATQAMRVRKITALTARLQKRIRLVAGPDAFNYVVGSRIALALPEPFGSRFDGGYIIEQAHPMISPLGDDSGFAMRVPITARPYDAAVYAWDPAEEETITDITIDTTRVPVAPPGALTADATEAVWLNQSGTLIPRIRFSGAPASEPNVSHYEWQYRVNDPGNGLNDNWLTGGDIDPDLRDGSGDVFGFVVGVDVNSDYDIRWRTVTVSGASDWVSITGVTFDADAPQTVADNSVGGQFFITRADAVTWRAGLASFIAGNYFVAEKQVYQFVTGATAIPDLPDVLPVGIVTGEHFTASGGGITATVKMQPQGGNVDIGNASSVIMINGLQVLGARIGGWTVPTGTATRTGFDTATATTEDVAQALKALIEDLHATSGQGIIGT